MTAGLEIPDQDWVLDAARQLSGHADVTPLMRDPRLDAIAGMRVWFKCECLQKTGSFKYRGAFNRLSRLTDEEKRHGVVAFSSGNHAQGVAQAAKELGLSAVIVMPTDAPKIKVQGVEADGGQIVFYDRLRDSREAIAAQISREENRVLVPSFDDPFIASGQGTAGVELYGQLKEKGQAVDALITPIGGGGLCAGLSLATQALSPKTTMYGAEPAGYDDHARSLRSGRRERLDNPPATLCDALMTPQPGQLTFAINGKSLKDVFVLERDDILLTMALLKDRLGLTVEPGGAVAAAAVLSGQFKARSGHRSVVAILSGGNVDPEVAQLAQALAAV